MLVSRNVKCLEGVKCCCSDCLLMPLPKWQILLPSLVPLFWWVGELTDSLVHSQADKYQRRQFLWGCRPTSQAALLSATIDVHCWCLLEPVEFLLFLQHLCTFFFFFPPASNFYGISSSICAKMSTGNMS